MIFSINLLLISGILILGYRFFRQAPTGNYYWPAVLLKLTMGILVGLLYRYYYQGGDTFAFFEAAIALKKSALSSLDNFVAIFLRNDYTSLPGFRYAWIPSAFFVKLLSCFALLTGDNYWLTSIYFSIISFFGLWTWVSVLTRLMANRYLAMIAGFFFPSLLFWSSGILKEALVIPALALLIGLFLKLYLGDKLRTGQVIVAVLLFAVLAILKYFIAAIFLALALAVLVSRRILPATGKWYSEPVTLALMLLLIGGLVSLLHPNLWPSRMATVIYQNYRAYLEASDPETIVVFSHLSSQVTGLILSLPKAVFAGLFMPVWPIPGAQISIFAVIENWALLLLTIAGVTNFSLPGSRDRRLLFWAGMICVITCSGLITLSTPNLGTLARYKTSYLLVLLPLLLPAIYELYRKLVLHG